MKKASKTRMAVVVEVGLVVAVVVVAQQLQTLLLLLSTVSAHVAWQYPPPRPSSDIKTFPCGANSAAGVGTITTMSSGLNEVVFDEFVCHAGDMVRIALSYNDTDDYYDDMVLLDRLPHNDLCDYTNSENLMAVTITLPPTHVVDCHTVPCSLQIIQVMSSKFQDESCANPLQISEMCGGPGRMYYSCARIQIVDESTDGETNVAVAAAEPSVFNDFYGALEPVDYKWPLVADWCRDDDDEPWRVCDTTPQALFTNAVVVMTNETNTGASILSTTTANVTVTDDVGIVEENDESSSTILSFGGETDEELISLDNLDSSNDTSDAHSKNSVVDVGVFSLVVALPLLLLYNAF